MALSGGSFKGANMTEEKRLYQQTWRAKNPTYKQQWLEKNPDKAEKAKIRNRESRRKWRLEHPVEAREAFKRWKENNKERWKALNKEWHAKRLEYINSHKDRPCMDCGVTYPRWIMDFDHREPKLKVGKVGDVWIRAARMEVLNAEIEKCDVVCANCHRERTYQRLQSSKLN